MTFALNQVTNRDQHRSAFNRQGTAGGNRQHRMEALQVDTIAHDMQTILFYTKAAQDIYQSRTDSYGCTGSLRGPTDHLSR